MKPLLEDLLLSAVLGQRFLKLLYLDLFFAFCWDNYRLASYLL